MKLPLDYDTSIDVLLNHSNKQTIFLSTWDKEIRKNEVPYKLIEKSTAISLPVINRYQYMDEMECVKAYISSAISFDGKTHISPEEIAIATNGTASSFLILRTLNQEMTLRPLLFTPIYFAYISVLKDLCDEIEFYQVFDSKEVSINFDEVEQIVKSKLINVIIINDPIFGCGISIKDEIYSNILTLCKKYDVILIVDHVYGGMEWNKERSIVHNFLIQRIESCNKIILIDSMPKRLLINGIKSALIFACPSFVRKIEKASVYTLGCMVYSQISLLQELYNPHNRSALNKIMNKNISRAEAHYDFLMSLTMGRKCYLENCDSGYFALLKMPYSIFGYANNIQIASLMLKDCNVLTIPHDRYLYYSKDYYAFRVNLMASKMSLERGINALIDEYD